MSVEWASDKADDKGSVMHITFGDVNDQNRNPDNLKSDNSDRWNKTFYDVLETCEAQSQNEN